MKTLEPTLVWNFFHEITQIPRPSKKEERIIAYLIAFGEKNNLKTKADDAGNVLICKPATKGYENRKTVTVSYTHLTLPTNREV